MTVDEFLAEHCTQCDDHDSENCNKCAEMKRWIDAYAAKIAAGAYAASADVPGSIERWVPW